MTETIKKIRKT